MGKRIIVSYESFRFVLLIALLAMGLFCQAEHRYVGGDVSLLPKYEEAGAQYKTHEGEPIGDVLAFCKDEGMNAMRVRVFVNPVDYDGPDSDPNACQTIESVIPLCKRIKEMGLDLILDFMYSDTWADPAKQWTPKQWQSLTDEQLYDKIFSYTKESLQTLKSEGITPDFIQPGNEISFGMLWGPYDAEEKELKKCLMGSDNNWSRLGKLLNNAIRACHEVCPDAKIIIHTERVASVDVQQHFYKKMESLNVDYDIIGVSYYPYWHGSVSVLSSSLSELETVFPNKNIMIVETGYPYKWEIPGTTEKVDYPYSDEGQNQFAKELVEMLKKHEKVNGLFWWWLEYNAYGTSLSNWYNAPLFDSLTGCATSALKTICSFANNDSGINDVIDDLSEKTIRWYNIQGNQIDINSNVKGILIGSDGTKILR